MENATIDHLDGPGFDAIYSGQIEPELVKLEAERRKALRTYGLIVLGGLALCVVEVVTVRAMGRGANTVLLIGVPAFTFLMAAIFGYFPLGKVGAMAKLGTIRALCAPLEITYQPEKFEPGAFQRFIELKLLPPPSSTTLQDQFRGHRDGREFELYEATIQEGAGKERVIVFSGQLFRIAYRSLSGVTVLLRDSGVFNRFQRPKGLEKVELPDPAYEKMFEAFSTKPLEALDILTPGYMAQLIALESAFGGKKLRCAFEDGQLLIAIEGSNRFEIGGMFSTLVNRKRVEKMARDISAVFKAIDSIPR